MVVSSSEDWELMLVAPFVLSFYNTAIVIILSFLLLLSRVVYVMYVYNRGYKPHSIPNIHRDKEKKLQNSFLFHCEESINHNIIYSS